MARVTSSSSTGIVSIQDSSGNQLTSSGGALNVNLVSAPASNINITATFNEITNVASGVEATIATYSNNNDASCYLGIIQASGTNVSEYRLYKNSQIIDKRYSSFTEFNIVFEFTTGNTSAPGLQLDENDVVYLKVLHTRPSVGNFNGNIIVKEVT